MTTNPYESIDISKVINSNVIWSVLDFITRNGDSGHNWSY